MDKQDGRIHKLFKTKKLAKAFFNSLDDYTKSFCHIKKYKVLTRKRGIE